jgi:octaprenyl-diphosphate synthase
VAPQAAAVRLADLQRSVALQLGAVAAELRRMISADLPLIEEVNSHLLQMKGKLFRPMLLFLANQAAEADDPRLARFAGVVELIHLATLVHDDSVDHSALRRGMPTINALFSHQVSVIMGDYLYSRAIIELVKVDDIEPLRIVSRVTNEMTVGEMRQLAAYDALRFTEEEYGQLIRAKTASLFGAACELGAMRSTPARRDALRAYGNALGMAFQVTDDLLDYTEGEAVTGKPSGLDLKEHKVTLPLIAALPRLAPEARREVEALFAEKAPADERVARVIELVGRAGGLEYARERAAEWAGQAEAALEELPRSQAREALRDAIVYAVERRY